MKALVFGEVLWDVFPNGKKLGGAPMNFCAHFTKLGAEGCLYSAVGKDELGDAVFESMDKLGLKKDFVAVNPQKRTGVCNVTLDEHGQPEYDLVFDVAYDNISASNTEIECINSHKFDVLYFGSLAQRNSVSANTVKEITESCSFKEVFCDINIRQNYYSKELIEECFARSTIIKINRDELELAKALEVISAQCRTIKDACDELCSKFDLKVVIVTLDSDGAAAYSYNDKTLCMSGRQPATLVSAVGAGDSFSACFLYNFLNGNDIKTCVERANILGAYVVGFEEAIPEYTEDLLRKIK
ncbi:MAG: hypothetical protein IKT39_06220 [Clostridia bacterium]|nr:hypothetical protein [Clostridia bacterium]MBR6524182.1 hypothetical protein [Clostridia bacterium]